MNALIRVYKIEELRQRLDEYYTGLEGGKKRLFSQAELEEEIERRRVLDVAKHDTLRYPELSHA
jgi:hypothetical protein